MEIIKTNETFNLTDSNETYSVSGTVTNNVNGTMDMYFTVNYLNGEYVGSFNYNKYEGQGNINFNLNCAESLRDELTLYSDSIIDYVLNYFSNME